MSHDSNILRTFVTDDEGIHDVWFVLVTARASDAESHKGERKAAAVTWGHSA